MIDYTSPVGRVRLLVPDTALLTNPRNKSEKRYIFSDPQIEAFLALSSGNIKRAAALACETVGTDKALQMLVISTDDKSTDGAKLLNAFVARARQLRAEADREEDRDGYFDIVYPECDPNTLRGWF